jgi:hypothetical protein
MLTIRFRIPLHLVLVVFLLLAGQAGLAQAKRTRLHELERLSAAVSNGTGSSGALVSAMMRGAYDPDLAAASDAAASLASNQQAFLANPSSTRLTVYHVAAAFDTWRGLIADPDTTPTSPAALIQLRWSVAQIAPSFVARDQNGQPSVLLSPAEAVYFLDWLIGHGGVATGTGAQLNTAAYDAAFSSYLASQPPAQRQQDIEDILNEFLLTGD